ncbi:putative kelch repeat protein [Neofusicoccum parvum]|uniref:Kelch repeat protein n=1 Tax=Neofusicoccum parvum TaxID=310453 RepID=A0ACB5SD23_9PEZI|nr:putative kelch repeat protein [Neofusicoccum parvum]
MSTSWTNRTVQIQTIDKGDAPSFDNPGLWPDGNSTIYLFSGAVSAARNVTPPETALWKLTIGTSGHGNWSKETPSNSNELDRYTRTNDGLVATSKDTGYVLGGQSSNLTDPNLTMDPNASYAGYPVPGLVSYNWTQRQWTNESATGYTTYGTALLGQMHYVPTFGREGFLFMFGGNALTLAADSQKPQKLDFTNITMYEPTEKRWYSQVTTGDRPSPRTFFCVVGAQGKNNTYEIFIMGGYYDFSDGVLDDIYILSLPGFHWFKVPTTTGSPRCVHTCNVVGKRQMLVVGGIGKPWPAGWEDPDPWVRGLGIFDMTQLSWSSGYDADAAEYESPEIVQEWYRNGNYDDGAGLNDEIRTLFATPSSNLESGSSNGNKNNSAIIGGTVGGAVVLALLAGLAWLVIRRRNKNSAQINQQSELSDGQGNVPGSKRGAHAEVDGEEIIELPTERVLEMPSNEVHELSPEAKISEMPPNEVHELPSETKALEMPSNEAHKLPIKKDEP